MNVVDALEAVLFAAEEPVPLDALAIALQLTEGQVAQAIEILEARLEDRGGIRLSKIAGGYQLSTKAEFAEVVGRYLKPGAQRLSKSLMEVLAVIAYKQPVTLNEIESIRGVQSDYGLRMLLERELIAEIGRKDTPGRPAIYGTTGAFLHQFNLNDLSELPPVGSEISLNSFNIS